MSVTILSIYYDILNVIQVHKVCVKSFFAPFTLFSLMITILFYPQEFLSCVLVTPLSWQVCYEPILFLSAIKNIFLHNY